MSRSTQRRWADRSVLCGRPRPGWPARLRRLDARRLDVLAAPQGTLPVPAEHFLVPERHLDLVHGTMTREISVLGAPLKLSRRVSATPPASRE